MIRLKSGPPCADLPYRYGCSCGAIWNMSEPIDTRTAAHTSALCSPTCRPQLFPLDETPASAGTEPRA